MKFIDELVALFPSATEEARRTSEQAIYAALEACALTDDRQLPGYYFELVECLARGQPTTAPRDVPEGQVGLVWVWDDLAKVVPGLAYEDDTLGARLTAPALGLRVVWRYLALNRERWWVEPCTPPPVVEPPPPFVGSWDPDEATLRRWAYDESLRLTPHDDDVAILQWKNVRLLLELAADPVCPRGPWLVRVLDAWMMDVLLHYAGDGPPFVDRVRELAAASPSDAVRAFAEHLGLVLAYLKGAGPVSAEEAERVARPLLLGYYNSFQLRRGRVGDWWCIDRVLSGTLRPPRLYVHEATGALVYTRWGALSAADLPRVGPAEPRTARLLPQEPRSSQGW